MRSWFEPIFAVAATALARLVERSALAQRFLRSVRFPGRRWIVDRLRGDRLSDDPIRVTIDDMTFDLSLRDDVQRSIYFAVYEREDLSLVDDLVSPGDVCLDIGANVGWYALQMARKVGPGGAVHAFEADPRVAGILERNRDLNRAAGVLHVHRKAVSSADGEASFFASAADRSGWGSLVRFDDIADHVVNVPTVRLDTFLQSEKIGRVALMKMDIEANEPDALAGAKRSLREQRFANVLIEFNGVRLSERGVSLQDMLRIFEEARYTPIRLNLEQLRACQTGALEWKTVVMNLLFVPAPAALSSQQ